ncbi:MAG: hypothetical protein IJ608_03660 [Lachnospiraceae bacterium]|nr:hypothetical protein [Lachnospiraceae bacterium]
MSHYIFLDVDGVLNTEADWARKAYSLNPHCIGAFCKLLNSLDDSRVVLSSTWRNGIARDGTTAVHINDLIKALKPAGVTKLDKTGVSPDGSRTKEIEHYLRRHSVDNYIILDDDPELFDQKENTPHLYLTSAKTGLTEADVTKILKMLKRRKG